MSIDTHTYNKNHNNTDKKDNNNKPDNNYDGIDDTNMTKRKNMTKNREFNKRKRIAIIGSGVSGLTCAHYLIKEHDVTVFEANDYIGGHVNTIDVAISNKTLSKRKQQKINNKQAVIDEKSIEHASIDTGFIVFNERTYPNFFRLLAELDVPFQKTDMSFSVKNNQQNFEYNGHTLNTFLAQRKNVFNPQFWQFTKDIVTFNKQVKAIYSEYNAYQNKLNKLGENSSRLFNKTRQRNIDSINDKISQLANKTLGDYLQQNQYGQMFKDNYLLPMVSAIWSMGLEDAKGFPLIFFAQFFENHGLLDIVERPQWFTIVGGSKQYVNKLVERFVRQGGQIKVNTPIRAVTRHTAGSTENNGVSVEYLCLAKTETTAVDKHNLFSIRNMHKIHKSAQRPNAACRLISEQFDEVIFACHADTAYQLLTDKSAVESEVLSAFKFTDNQAILHTDSSVLPKKTRAWASWNYLLDDKTKMASAKPVLTYHMNILQRLIKKHNYLVTLNHQVDDKQVIKRINYRHPVYDMTMTHAQSQWQSISNHKHTHFCGAYWFNGFHEDGVKSALRVCQDIHKKSANTRVVDILYTVQKEHLNSSKIIDSLFTYGQIPFKADKKQGKINKRQVLFAKTNQLLNNFCTDNQQN